jgi:SAM-dependent methyltransferase
MHARLPEMRGDILEIGPGTIKTTRKILRKNINKGACTWSGIDPVWSDPKCPGAYRGTVGNLPFADGSFDHVMAFESMEHWEEYGDPVSKGLSEIHRVLRPGGRYLATVPIHGHGKITFVRGDMFEIASWFHPLEWVRLKFEPWRKEFAPCPQSTSWLVWNNGKYADLVRQCSDQSEPSTWCLEIQAWK